MTSDELYNRLLNFGRGCQKHVKMLPKTIYNLEYGSQLIRSSASTDSNYIEALEAAGSKDFCYRLKICRKETRESKHWLYLLLSSNQEIQHINNNTKELLLEASELIRIFTSSILTSEKNQKMIK